MNHATNYSSIISRLTGPLTFILNSLFITFLLLPFVFIDELPSSSAVIIWPLFLNFQVISERPHTHNWTWLACSSEKGKQNMQSDDGKMHHVPVWTLRGSSANPRRAHEEKPGGETRRRNQEKPQRIVGTGGDDRVRPEVPDKMLLSWQPKGNRKEELEQESQFLEGRSWCTSCSLCT